LLHTLRMYRTMLDKPDVFENDVKQCDDEEDEKSSIDDIFINITKIYKPYHIEMIYNTIIAIADNAENYETYISGLNMILEPIHGQINKWICDNIVF